MLWIKLKNCFTYGCHFILAAEPPVVSKKECDSVVLVCCLAAITQMLNLGCLIRAPTQIYYRHNQTQLATRAASKPSQSVKFHSNGYSYRRRGDTNILNKIIIVL